MSRYDADRALHRARCRDTHCPACQHDAESRAADTSPDFDESAAATTWERAQGL